MTLETIAEIRRDNVRKLQKSSGLDKKAFAEKVDIQYVQLNHYIGKNPSKSIGDIVSRRIEEKLDLAKGYLDHIHEDDNTGRTPDKIENKINNLDNNFIRSTKKLLPVLSWIQAGQWTGVESVQAMDVQQWLPALSEDDGEECFYLEVKGVSNDPVYIEGDFILVDPCVYVGDLVSGDLIAVQNEEGETFKKLIIESNERKYLQALNPKWEPNIIEFTVGTRLIGLVIDAFRPIGGSKRKRVRKN